MLRVFTTIHTYELKITNHSLKLEPSPRKPFSQSHSRTLKPPSLALYHRAVRQGRGEVHGSAVRRLSTCGLGRSGVFESIL